MAIYQNNCLCGKENDRSLPGFHFSLILHLSAKSIDPPPAARGRWLCVLSDVSLGSCRYQLGIYFGIEVALLHSLKVTVQVGWEVGDSSRD